MAKFRAKRTRVTLSKRKLGEHVSSIEDCNRKLREILDEADEARTLAEEAGMHEESSRASSRTILRFWRHASCIYDLVKKSWRCHCRTLHYGLLLLEHNPESSSTGRLKILVGSTISLPGECARKQVQAEIQIVVLNTDATTRSQASSRRQPIASSSRVGNTRPLPAYNSGITSNRYSEIHELCSVVHRDPLCAEPSCVGQFTDHKNDKAYAVFREASLYNNVSQSLSGILESKGCGPLPRNVRYMMALNIASSYLQLYSTPWLEPYLLDSEILVPLDATNNCPHGQLCVENTLDRPLAGNQNSSFEAPSCADLAVLLLELCFGLRLQSDREWCKLEQDLDRLARRRIITGIIDRWARMVIAEAGPGFHQAVEWCLGTHTSLTNDDQWRYAFADNVVEPLQSCCNYMSRAVEKARAREYI